VSDEKLTVALRVLSAVCLRTHPVSIDVDLLRKWVPQADRHAEPDELARIVVFDELQRRKDSRTTGADDSHNPR
jgi:hypothetical protein